MLSPITNFSLNHKLNIGLFHCATNGPCYCIMVSIRPVSHRLTVLFELVLHCINIGYVPLECPNSHGGQSPLLSLYPSSRWQTLPPNLFFKLAGFFLLHLFLQTVLNIIWRKVIKQVKSWINMILHISLSYFLIAFCDLYWLSLIMLEKRVGKEVSSLFEIKKFHNKCVCTVID